MFIKLKEALLYMKMNGYYYDKFSGVFLHIDEIISMDLVISDRFIKLPFVPSNTIESKFLEHLTNQRVMNKNIRKLLNSKKEDLHSLLHNYLNDNEIYNVYFRFDQIYRMNVLEEWCNENGINYTKTGISEHFPSVF